MFGSMTWGSTMPNGPGDSSTRTVADFPQIQRKVSRFYLTCFKLACKCHKISASVGLSTTEILSWGQQKKVTTGVLIIDEAWPFRPYAAFSGVPTDCGRSGLKNKSCQSTHYFWPGLIVLFQSPSKIESLSMSHETNWKPPWLLRIPSHDHRRVFHTC